MLISRIKKSPYLRTIIFFISFVWFLRFSGIVLPVYFLKSGLSFAQISFGITLSIVGQILGIFLLAKLRTTNKRAWLIALLLYVASFSLYIVAPLSLFYYFAGFISGIGSILFYGSFNLSMFSVLPRDKMGSGSAMFFNLLAVLGIIAPIFSALVAGSSIYLLLFLSVCFSVFACYLIKLPVLQQIEFTIREATAEVRHYKLPIYLHGVHESMSYIIPLLTLSLLSDFMEFGTFGTVMAIVGVAVSHYVGIFSDKLKSKRKFLVMFAFLLSGVTMLYAFPFFKSGIIIWTALNIVNNFIDKIYDQTSLAFIMDETASLVHAIFGRELYLNFGRLTGMTVAFLGFAFPSFLPYAVITLGLSMFAFGIVIYNTKQNKFVV